MIIGITGNYACGKDSAAEILQEKGFEHFSLSDFLREELQKRGEAVTRDNLIRIGNELRFLYGPAVLAANALQKAAGSKDYVITSIRNPAEVELLQKRKNFLLIKITAPEEVRLKRIILRNREEDPKTLAELREKELRENSSDPNAQQLKKVAEMASESLSNETTIEDLKAKIENMVGTKKKELGRRPSWDEYFIDIMKAVAERGTCDRGKTAAVIVKDNRILTTGYVGAPKGLPHCDEIGHQMKKVIHEDGKETQHCLRTNHAELNAIAQAARNGVSIEGATIYCKMAPCATCAKMIINCGIKRVVAQLRYHGDFETAEMFKAAGIQYDILNEEMEKYDKQ